MNGGSAIAPTAVAPLARRALSLRVANAFDYALQFLLPVVLVRCLEPEDFGQYRMLWLAVGTAMAVMTQAMGRSLFYYLPRSHAPRPRPYIHQTLCVVAASRLLARLAV